MALIKCGECGKQISSNANACPACGNPIGGGSAGSNSAFEKRIEQYKTSGYKLEKRNVNTVQMIKQLSAAKSILYMIIAIVVPMILLVVLFIMNQGYSVLVILTPIFAYILCFIFILSGAKQRRVNISITTTGKIEETGNVLKNK